MSTSCPEYGRIHAPSYGACLAPGRRATPRQPVRQRVLPPSHSSIRHSATSGVWSVRWRFVERAALPHFFGGILLRAGVHLPHVLYPL